MHTDIEVNVTVDQIEHVYSNMPYHETCEMFFFNLLTSSMF